MPTVPQASPQVQSRPIDPGFQSASAASIDAFGALGAQGAQRLGRSLQQLGDEGFKLALRNQIEDNEREAKNLDVQLTSAIRIISDGDGTPQNAGYFQTRGENALAGYAPAKTQVEKAREKLLQSAKNDRVREMFADVSAKRVEHELDKMSRFVGQERRRAADTVAEARMSEAANDAARAWNDPATLRRSIGIAAAEVRDMAERNGWTEEVIKAKAREANGVVIGGTIKAALAADANGTAARLFKEFGADLSPGDRATISRQLREGSIAGTALALSKQAEALYPGDLEKQVRWLRDAKADPRAVGAAMGQMVQLHGIIKQVEQEKLRGQSQADFDRIVELTTDPNEQIRLARALPVERRDAVESRLRAERAYAREAEADLDRVQRRAEHEISVNAARVAAQEKAENKEAYKAADDLISQGGSLTTLSVELRSRLTPEQRKALESYEEKLAKGERYAKVTDNDKYDQYLNMGPAELAEVSRAEMAAVLTQKDFETIDSRRKDALTGKLDPKSPYSVQARVNQKLGKEFGSMSDGEKKRANDIRGMVDQEIRAAVDAKKGKRLTGQEETDIINRIFDKVAFTEVGRVWNSEINEPLYKVYQRIPQTKRDEISRKLQSQGLPATATNVVEYYILAQKAALPAKGAR